MNIKTPHSRGSALLSRLSSTFRRYRLSRLFPLATVLAASFSYAQNTPQNAQPGPVTQTPTADPNLPGLPDVPPISPYVPPVPTTKTGTPADIPQRSAPNGLDGRRYLGIPLGPFRAPTTPELLTNSGARLQALVRGGKLYLSAKDAIALAIENNLDVEIERYNLLLSDTDLRRAKGGGNLRGIDFTIAEPPNGVGGPGSPLLNADTTSTNPITPTVTDLTSLNSTTQITTNLAASSTATAQYATGPAIPLFDPNVFLAAGFLRRSDTVTLTSTTGTAATGTAGAGGTVTEPQPLDYTALNLSYIQGFHFGGQLEATVNNDSQVIFGSVSQLDPFSTPSTSTTFTQPLLRGRGAVNVRYIRIANENRKISRLLFEQQVLETVYGASRIYFDLVSLGENVGVKLESLRAAKQLEDDDASQVELGTLAPIELTRAHALVGSSQFDLTQAQGLYQTQEVILRNLITRPDQPVFNAAYTEIVPTDRIVVPPALDNTPIDQLIQQGLARRPDLAQLDLQVRTGQISAEASRNQVLPQLNAYANVETRGSSEQPYEQLGSPGTAIPTLPQNFALGGLRVSTIIQGGIQLNLPIRNRLAASDAARDVIQVRQAQARTEKLENQIREDIEGAEVAVETSFAAYNAATTSRGFQEQLLQAERDKLQFGQSTNLLVVQDEAYLAQARSTEIAARSNYQKARIELDRSLGDLLEKNGISLDEAVQGQLKP